MIPDLAPATKQHMLLLEKQIDKQFKQLNEKFYNNQSGSFGELGSRFSGIYQKYTTALIYYIKATDVAMVIVPLILSKVNATIQLMVQVATGVNAYLVEIDKALADAQNNLQRSDEQSLLRMKQASQEIMSHISRIMQTFGNSIQDLQTNTATQ